MTIHEEHLDMVTRLAKPGEEIQSSLNPKHAHELHMALGLTTEVLEILEALVKATEIPQEAIIEEFGDFEFYLAGLSSSVGFPNVSLKRDDPGPTIITTLLTRTGTVADLVKKIVIYEQEQKHKELLVELSALREALDETYAYLGLSVEQAKQANIHKLLKGPKARYANGTFTNEAAQQRADKAE